MDGIVAVAVGFLLTAVVMAIRIWLVLRRYNRCLPGKKGAVSLLVVAGSGGHTTEILRLLGSLSKCYTPTHYVIAETDKMSEDKIKCFESSRPTGVCKHLYSIYRIPRSREVRQSWCSSFFTTLRSILYSFPLTTRVQPDVILCNGPGTCVPVCLSALLLGIFGIKKIIVIYVESICRVESLSLSGRILYYFSDYFIVQWPSLKEKYPNSIYLGRIV
ncbi:UDP-N-acetylglucosamine transferase subunit ALG14 homolog [Spea bombifrons]|uniref:UDP-N-acetylglucosamine transferase subunit ALG14 homolog n=1 Tax=Spea bombifrons TaxID=233779 RepID=UPI002349AF61|nr:UDP-N-acetylglucosamine transferase subunit ALG14 homolog [Spea bombifrons]